MDAETLYIQIREAIAANLSLHATAANRAQSSAFIEKVQNIDGSDLAMSTTLMQIGFKMIVPLETDGHLQVSYVQFGFALIESSIRRSWNQFDAETKVRLKTQFEQLLTQSGTLKHKHLKDCLSRCIVEVMFREWPQNWPQFLPYMLSE